MSSTPPNSPEPDITFDEFLEQALQYPCPCEECSPDLPFHTIEEAQRSLNYYREIWELLASNPTFDYEPPPTSPTNREMHAINGNIEHQRKLLHLPRPDTPFVRDVVDVLNGAHEMYQEIPQILEHFRGQGKYSSDDAMRHYKKYFANKGKFYDAGTPEYDEWWNTYQQTLKPSQLKKLKKITNKEQHAKNGNVQNKLKWEWNPNHPPQLNLKDDEADNDAKIMYEHLQAGDNPAQIIQETGPSNKEMHAYNGNPPKMGPRTKAQHERIARRRLRNAKKRAETKAYLKVIKAGAAPFPARRPNRKKLPKGVKAAAKLESEEKRIANKYMRFLKNPVFAPPRLGSTGNMPTNLVHGYLRRTYDMSAPFNSVTNATCFVACVNPVMFRQFVSSTNQNFVGPIEVGVGTGVTSIPTTGNATADFDVLDFNNATALKRSVIGDTSTDKPNPMARLLGASITLECRCPMSTTAPPFLYAGLLDRYPMEQGSTQTVSNITKIINMKFDSMRNLPESLDEPGFQISSVYQPNSPNDLLFNQFTTRNSSASASAPPASIPYVALNNCPTNASVTITVSCWYEVHPNNMVDSGGLSVSTSQYGGWRTGPKVSSEDVFDNLKRFRSVSRRAIGMGAKAVSGVDAYAAILAADHGQTPQQQTIDLIKEIQQLKQEYALLKVKIEEEEDEKYFDCEATPTLDKQEAEPFRGLSKSTIDLAMSIKKSLTPGSVTNKTVQHVIQ